MAAKKFAAKKPAVKKPAVKKPAVKIPAKPPVLQCRCTCEPTVLNVAVFSGAQVAAGGNVIGPVGGLDLSGYRDYRLVLRIDGPPNSTFKINELYGPAGSVQQLNIDIGDGTTDQFGGANYRKVFDVLGPKWFFIRVFNESAGVMTVNGSIYAVK
ncbi:hypothetical protein [Aestuariivirga sp.]|uniref:hypothetical protein n=1 Tax=Aestuariivirga sp. TaxID=2650926 RepID=UPI0025B88C35|nr:hypothetical protein [Aestuariivirga sp.]